MAPRVPPGSTPPPEIAYTLTPDDVTTCYLHLWRNTPHGRPHFKRGWLRVVSVYFGIMAVELLIAAAGGLAVAVYFIARAASTPVQRANGRAGQMLALYIVTASLVLLYGFWPRHFLWRFVDWVLRQIQRQILKKKAARAYRRGDFNPLWQYRVSLTAAGLTRVVERSEQKGGIDSFERRTEFAPWTALATIDVGPAHCFALSANAEFVFIVPARAFPTAADFAEFIAEAQRRKQTATAPHGSPVDSPRDEQRPTPTDGRPAAQRATGIMVRVENVSTPSQVTGVA